MSVYNLSSFTIPSPHQRYLRETKYYSETSKQFNLAQYSRTDIGTGMTTFDNQITILENGQPTYDRLFSEMKKAKSSINLELYIIRDDQTGKRFKNILIQKAREGVEVRLIYDAFGCFFTNKSYFQDLKKNGVKVAAYNPPGSALFQGRINNRLHRKIIVIDGHHSFIGGENIGDEYLGKKKIGYWRDTDVLFSGGAAHSLQQVFLYDWFLSTKERISALKFFPKTKSISSQKVTIIPGGPESSFNNMGTVHLKLISSARQKIYIESPYFIPSSRVLKALNGASEKGIEIHLLIPRKADHWVTKLAGQYYMGKVLKHGVKISTYDKGFLHSKLIIVDSKVVSVGSANFNQRSFSKDYEITSIVYNKDTVRQFEQVFFTDLKSSNQVSPENFNKRNPIIKMFEILSVIILKVI
jgi:cardiolipin synthase